MTKILIKNVANTYAKINFYFVSFRFSIKFKKIFLINKKIKLN
jgi:hypothetical protein